MTEPVELFCTQDDGGMWHVWFPRPLGGMYILDSFDHETDALAFWQQQMDSADFDAE